MVVSAVAAPMSRRPLWIGIALGAAAFGAREWSRPAPTAADLSDPVEAAIAAGLDQGDALVERRLLRDMAFLGYTGRPEALLAEARRLGLHRSDEVIRRHLALQLAEAQVQPPSAAQLQAQQAALCTQPARHRTAEQPDRWLTARDLERQYPASPPTILETQPEATVDTASCRTRALASAWAVQLRASLP